MKDYNTVVAAVKRALRFNSKKYTNGYVYALLDWRVISQPTYERLKDLIEKDTTIKIAN